MNLTLLTPRIPREFVPFFAERLPCWPSLHQMPCHKVRGFQGGKKNHLKLVELFFERNRCHLEKPETELGVRSGSRRN